MYMNVDYGQVQFILAIEELRYLDLYKYWSLLFF